MAFRDSLIEYFPCGPGIVGYNENGRVRIDSDLAVGEAPVLDAIWGIQDPTEVAAAFAQARTAPLAEPVEIWGEVAGLIFEGGNVRAELDLPEDSYEQQMTLDEFEPMLRAWEKAWRGAQARNASHA